MTTLGYPEPGIRSANRVIGSIFGEVKCRAYVCVRLSSGGDKDLMRDIEAMITGD